MGHIEKTAADKSALGFEYQDLVLVDILVGLKVGESIGLEIFDDLHTENITNDLKLIQVKHSLLGGNITERDTDLWKTLYNWLESLPDLPKDKQIKFELYTNKNLNNQNLVDLLKNSKINKIKIVETIKTIYEDLVEAEKIKDKTASQHPILKFAEALASAEPESLDFILDRFEFHTDPSAINKK